MYFYFTVFPLHLWVSSPFSPGLGLTCGLSMTEGVHPTLHAIASYILLSGHDCLA